MSTPEGAPAAGIAAVPADPDFPPPAPGAPSPRTSRLVLAAAAFQLLVLAWMVYNLSSAFRVARTVQLQVEPVDPRDLFRGEYVTLAYPFSRVPAEGVEGLDVPLDADHAAEWLDRPVFVPLAPEDPGRGRYRGGRPSAAPPAGGIPFLQGTLESPSRITFGIESFYVQEGRGREYERAAAERRLWAEVDVTSAGFASLRGLQVE